MIEIIVHRDDPVPVIIAAVGSAAQVARADLRRRRAQPVKRGHGGEGIVDARRQRPQRDLDQFVDQEFDILRWRSHRAQRKASAQAVGQARVQLRPHHRQQHHVGMDEIARPQAQLDAALRVARDPVQPGEIDDLDIAGARRRHRRPLGRLVLLFGAAIMRETLAHAAQQPLANAFQHRVDADRRGHMVEEIDQHRDRRRHQPGGDHQRQLRHESRIARRLIGVAHHAQHQHGIDEGRDEGRERQLVAAILHEIGEQARAIAARCIDDGGDGDRKDGRCDPDHRPGYDVEDVARALGPRLVHPFMAGQPFGRAMAIEPDGQDRQQRRAQREERGIEPVAGPRPLPERAQPGDHGSALSHAGRHPPGPRSRSPSPASGPGSSSPATAMFRPSRCAAASRAGRGTASPSC